jgi:hypothetical protein
MAELKITLSAPVFDRLFEDSGEKTSSLRYQTTYFHQAVPVCPGCGEQEWNEGEEKPMDTMTCNKCGLDLPDSAILDILSEMDYPLQF